MSSPALGAAPTPLNTSFGLSMPCIAPNAVLRPYYVRLAEEPHPSGASGLFASSASRRAVVAMMDFWGQTPNAATLQRNYVVLHLPVGGRAPVNVSANAPYAARGAAGAGAQAGTPTTSAPVRYVVSQTLMRQCTAVADLLDDIDSVVPTRTAPLAPNPTPTAASIAATLADQSFSEAAYPGAAGVVASPSSPSGAPSPSSNVAALYCASTVAALKQFVQQNRGGASAGSQVVTLSDALDEVFDAALDATAQLDVDATTCEAVEALLEFCIRAVDLSPPSVLPRPLVCPLEYVIQPWEMYYLTHFCAGPSGTGQGGVANTAGAVGGCSPMSALEPGVVLGASGSHLTPRKAPPSPQRSTSPGARQAGNGSVEADVAGAQARAALAAAASAPVIIPTNAAARGHPGTALVCPATAVPAALQVLRVADYLGQAHLRDLTAGYIASTLLAARSEAELAAALHVDRLPTDDELEPIYRTFPFLAPQGTSAPSPITTPVAPTRAASAIAARRL